MGEEDRASDRRAAADLRRRAARRRRRRNITYQALFKSTDGGASFAFVRELEIATYASGNEGIYRAVAPNGDVMLVGNKGGFLSTDDGVTFAQKSPVK